MKSLPPDKPKPPHPFVAPEGYFADLPARIQQRVDGVNTQQPAPGFLPRWAYAVASVFAIAAVSAWLMTRPAASTTTQTATLSAEQLLAEVPTETLVDYLLLAEVDVMNTAALSEAEQTELLEELEVSDPANELFLDKPSDEDN